MTIALHGHGVSRGIAIGKAHLLERGQLEVSEYAVAAKEIDSEIKRLEQALTVGRQQLRAIRDQIPQQTAADIAAFIDTHLLMLEDSALTHEPARIIRELACNAEWALKLQRDALVRVFDEMDDPYLRTRRDDIDHVVQRVQRILLNEGPLSHEMPDSKLRDYVVLADDLTPADTVLMEHHGIAAFVTEYGGPTSHTAILARSLGIPGIVGLYQALRYVREDDLIIIDGKRGVAIVEPEQGILDFYRTLQQEDQRYFADLRKLKESPAVTLDGHEVELQANVELAQDFAAVIDVGATGVGLYRTEFLYMNRPTMPDEDEQFQSYKEVIESLQGIPLTIRTLDLGADKQVDGGRAEGPAAANPALGLRAVRLCLQDPDLFKPQLRAIVRSSAVGPVRMMIPMLSNLQEVEQVIAMVRDTQNKLGEANVDFDPNMPVGGMIEVPAAALCADVFVRHLDFLSIGTNDLIQYTMAIDRVNDEVNYLYDPLHPAVLRLIRMTIEAGQRSDTPVAMCGEMAGEARYVRLLLAFGLRQFSVHPAALLEVKRIVNETRIDAFGDFTEQVLASTSGAEISDLLEQIN